MFIDAVHTEKMVSQHLELWWPKVRPGGFIAGHDYAPEKPARHPGPVLAATRFANVHSLGSRLIGVPGTSFVIVKPADA